MKPAVDKSLRFKLTVEFDRDTGGVTAAYLLIRDGKSAKTREFADGNVLADYDSSGCLLGIELLAPCEPATIGKIARKEPKLVRNFLLQSIPRGLEAAVAQ
jgi:uncharacterized protein YuzE